MGNAEISDHLAVGMVFLPRTDLAAQERSRSIVEREILNFGYKICGWRQVPVDIRVIGEMANLNRPEIEQIIIANSKQVALEQFESELYLVRRRIEKQLRSEHIKDFYICSLSCRSIIYKGMFLAEQLSDFYPDLLDESFVSSFAIFHQRYSTNTFPNWHLAQPFRVLAHNGEINTIRGNLNWTRSHEPAMATQVYDNAMEELLPVVPPGASDSAALDSVMEILIKGGRSLPMAKTLMIPDTWSLRPTVPKAHRDFYEYCNAVMEPWDGPAALVGTHYPWLVAGMDRNGLRPLRYAVTRDNLLIVGSETGMVRVFESEVIKKGRLGPGQMIAVDLERGRFLEDVPLKNELSQVQPFSEWVDTITTIEKMPVVEAKHTVERGQLQLRQKAYGWTFEDLELILQPMAKTGKEAIGSMGDDSPLAVLNSTYRGLHTFFRQNFSQVTNPPIDSLRERQVMSLKTRLRNLSNILDESVEQCRHVQLESPVLTNTEFATLTDFLSEKTAEIDCTFETGKGERALEKRIREIQKEAAELVRAGNEHLVLTDKRAGRNKIALPMILVAGAVHTHLVQNSLRTFTSINVQAGEVLDVHYVAVLIGVGATTINPYLAEATLKELSSRKTAEISAEQAVQNYKKALENGLLKIMSKLGISVISSYRGGYNFEALGLSRSLVDEFFPAMPSKISGIGLSGLQEKVVEVHLRAYQAPDDILDMGGFYRYRRHGEPHRLTAEAIHQLQKAVKSNSYSQFKDFSQQMNSGTAMVLRDLLDFNFKSEALDLELVESITEIRKRFVSPGMSLGALSQEAHETLAIAMNQIGAKSNSGEGGEQPERQSVASSGANAASAIKQVASGRFGVTAAYLNNCREIEIKMAQGAKPGEGGQLPGFKVSADIAKLRHSTEGVTLISPPPHHDIYSIEDLAQLIYDLKQINPQAQVCVKLVARAGVGTIAAGVAKAMADVILISGHSGGTGASPQTSLKYAGAPWEMGLSEVHQVLTLNGLRHRVKLRTDGGITTGRDIVMAALLGAEEYGIGTASLIALGCLLVRQCHSNTCPVGICTQDKKLRKKFLGTPQHVVNLFSLIAEETREILAELGASSIEEIVGRTDLLTQVSRGGSHLDDLDLNPLLARADSEGEARTCQVVGRNEVAPSLDESMLQDAVPTLERGEKMQLAYNVRNTHRAVGTRLSSKLTRAFGMEGLKPEQLTVQLRGSAGQSLGAFAVQGLMLEVFGDANDYVGKGLSGGTIAVRPMVSAKRETSENAIIGNACLYGATSGWLFAAGQAGDRFAVRNSGAKTVVEGCGANGCEYMTGGVAVILGKTGDNFAAGMTGGMAYVYDAFSEFPDLINTESVLFQRLEVKHWQDDLKTMVEGHVAKTNSLHGRRILELWEQEVAKFWQVIPKEMVPHLKHPFKSANKRIS